MKPLYGGIRASKFRKRMRERLIENMDVMILRKEIPSHHEDYNYVSLTFKYKGEMLRLYPPKDVEDNSQSEFFSNNYGSTTLCALLLIDAYFARKHEVTLNMSGAELFQEAFEEDDARRKAKMPGIWNRRDMSGYFLRHVAEDLMLLLKICDRRTGKRSLRKIWRSDMPSDFAKILTERLVYT